MTVWAITEQAETLDVGDEWVVAVECFDTDGYPVAATVTGTVTVPAGTTSALTVVAGDEPGVYYARHTLATAGRYLAALSAAGGAVGAAPFTVEASPLSGALPTLAQVKTYLGETSASDAEIQDALDAETAAQRARCRVPAYVPADLAQALKRRVARNLAARGVPIATFTSFEGGGTSARVPMLDAEIARFEGPHRKRKVG